VRLCPPALLPVSYLTQPIIASNMRCCCRRQVQNVLALFPPCCLPPTSSRISTAHHNALPAFHSTLHWYRCWFQSSSASITHMHNDPPHLLATKRCPRNNHTCNSYVHTRCNVRKRSKQRTMCSCAAPTDPPPQRKTTGVSTCNNNWEQTFDHATEAWSEG
jgi:hypothetical protein